MMQSYMYLLMWAFLAIMISGLSMLMFIAQGVVQGNLKIFKRGEGK